MFIISSDMKKRIFILSCLLAISSFAVAQTLYDLEIKMADGTVKTYPMHQVIKVIRENRQTIIYIKSKETQTIQVFKDTDIASIEWKQSKSAGANAWKEDNPPQDSSSQK